MGRHTHTSQQEVGNFFVFDSMIRIFNKQPGHRFLTLRGQRVQGQSLSFMRTNLTQADAAKAEG